MIACPYAVCTALATVNFQDIGAWRARGNADSVGLGVGGYVHYGQATVDEYDVQRELHVDHGERVIGVTPEDE